MEIPLNLLLFLGIVSEEGTWILLSTAFPFYSVLVLSFSYLYFWMRTGIHVSFVPGNASESQQ